MRIARSILPKTISSIVVLIGLTSGRVNALDLQRRDVFDSLGDVYTVWITEYQNCGCPTTSTPATASSTLAYNVVEVNNDSPVQDSNNQASVLATATLKSDEPQVSTAQPLGGFLNGESTSTSFVTIKKHYTSTTVVHVPQSTAAPAQVDPTTTITRTATVTFIPYTTTKKVTVLDVTTLPASAATVSIAGSSSRSTNSLGPAQVDADERSRTTSTSMPLFSTTVSPVSKILQTTGMTVASTGVQNSLYTAVSSSSSTISTPELAATVTTKAVSVSKSSVLLATVSVAQSSTAGGASILAGAATTTTSVPVTSALSSSTTALIPSSIAPLWSNSTMIRTTSSSSLTPVSSISEKTANKLAVVATSQSLPTTTTEESAPTTMASTAPTGTQSTVIEPTMIGTQTWPLPTATTTIITYVTQS